MEEAGATSHAAAEATVIASMIVDMAAATTTLARTAIAMIATVTAAVTAAAIVTETVAHPVEEEATAADTIGPREDHRLRQGTARHVMHLHRATTTTALVGMTKCEVEVGSF